MFPKEQNKSQDHEIQKQHRKKYYFYFTENLNNRQGNGKLSIIASTITIIVGI